MSNIEKHTEEVPKQPEDSNNLAVATEGYIKAEPETTEVKALPFDSLVPRSWKSWE